MFSALTNTILGLAFLATGLAATFLMYHLWGYPFDHEKLKSSAPPRWMLLHRVLGWIYLATYLLLMSQMIPRLWHYQIEFPPRTVAHIVLGMTIGVILFIKVMIVRFFKHLEGTLAPFLGTSLLICTFLLLGLSVPFSLRTLYLERHAPGGSAFGDENLRRVALLLTHTTLPGDIPLSELATANALHQGRSLLMADCVQCHDLRTVLARPRTPDDWAAVVQRMSDRATIFRPIAQRDQSYVLAYLVAISPDLQQAAARQREQNLSHAAATQASLTAVTQPFATENFDLARSQQIFEMKCVQCHALSRVAKHPPKTQQQAQQLVSRMVDNGLEASSDDLNLIVSYLTKTYAK